MQYKAGNNKKKILNRKVLLALLFLAILLVVGGLLYSQRNSQVAEESNPSDTETINLEPPSDEVLEETERHKQELIENEQPSASTSTAKKQKVMPVFGYLQQANNGNVEANGYISEAIESDGTCTLALEKNGQKVSKSKQALPDAQSTICGQIVIERNQLSAGDWKATITYSSSKHQGVSEDRVIRIE